MQFGAIAAGHEATLEAAEEVLRAGGNAYDAAIAAVFTLFAAEPCMGSAGAGGFAMCHSPDQGSRLLDFFTQTPQLKDMDRDLDLRPIVVDFGTEQETFHVGMASIAVPGVMAGIAELNGRYGTMPLSDLTAHARQLSKEGVRVNAFGEIDMGLLQEIFRLESSVEDIFFRDGAAKKEGDTMVYPHLADFLDHMASEGPMAFYQGEIGAKTAQAIYDGGGFLQRSDFESYQARWSHPMRVPYHGMELCLPNGPSYGGAIIALLDWMGNKGQVSLAEAIREVKETIYEKDRLEESMLSFLPELSYRLNGVGPATKGTTHFSIMDTEGNAIALTMSIGEGSGYWIPGTDQQMNNMLGELFLLPNGAHSWRPASRLNSMMTPVMLKDRSGRVVLASGSGGAGRIPYVIYQTIEALIKKGLSLEEATRYPRQHWHEGVLHFEEGAELDMSMNVVLKEWKELSLFFGGVHSVYSAAPGQMEAAGDPRRYGVAKVI